MDNGELPLKTAAIVIPPLNGESTCWLSVLAVKEGQAVKAQQMLGRVEALGVLQSREAQTAQPAAEDKRADRADDKSHALVSPMEGYVVGLHAAAGQTVHPGEILCYICSQPSVPMAQPIQPAVTTSSPGFDPSALLIFGGGGHGKTVIDLVRAMGTYHIAGVIDDTLPRGSQVLGVPVIGGAGDLAEWYERGVRLAVNAVGGIGNVAVRLKVFDLLTQAGFAFPTLVHPSAVVERSAVLEAGVQVLAQCYVGSAARVGFGTVLNAQAIVHHDCVIGQVVNLSPGATLAGNVIVEDHAQIGMRATVNLKLRVGRGALLGNACTVKADVPPGGRVYAGTIWPVRKPPEA